MPEIKRHTAYKVFIKDILRNQYISSSGQTSSYITIGTCKVARVNIMCFVTSVSGNTLVVDDGSGFIDCKAFENPEQLNKVKTGEVYNIIGKVREFNDKRYIVPEIISFMGDRLWLSVWKEEISSFDFGKDKENSKSVSILDSKKGEEVSIKSLPDKSSDQGPSSVIDLIKELDDGKGAPMEKIIELSSSDKVDAYINQLLNEGEIFEISPGLLKIL